MHAKGKWMHDKIETHFTTTFFIIINNGRDKKVLTAVNLICIYFKTDME